MSSTDGDDFPTTSDEVPEADALEQARPVTDEADDWPSVTSSDEDRIESPDPDDYDWSRNEEETLERPE